MKINHAAISEGKMKKVLLLGAGGFIGGHLTEALSKTGKYEITGLDKDPTKIQEILKDINFIKMDITKEKNKRRLSSLIRKNDIIVSLIAICNPALYVKEPIATFKLGFLENLKIVDLCVKHDKRLIQFSTCEVLGKSPAVFIKNKKFYFHEDTSPVIRGPINKQRWIYACGKELLERVIHAYGLKNQLSYSVIRPFNYIGPKIDYLPSESGAGCPRVISHFIDALLYNKPMYLVNGGMQRRCYTYIEDATDAHVRIIHNKQNLCHNQVFNVGLNENETTIKNLAIQMRRIYKENFLRKGQKLPEIKSMPGEKFYGVGYDDIDRRLLDNTKIKKRTGWVPKWDLKSMLYETMKYYIDVSSGTKKKKR